MEVSLHAIATPQERLSLSQSPTRPSKPLSAVRVRQAHLPSPMNISHLHSPTKHDSVNSSREASPECVPRFGTQKIITAATTTAPVLPSPLESAPPKPSQSRSIHPLVLAPSSAIDVQPTPVIMSASAACSIASFLVPVLKSPSPDAYSCNEYEFKTCTVSWGDHRSAKA
jgi:hypothetical protein